MEEPPSPPITFRHRKSSTRSQQQQRTLSTTSSTNNNNDDKKKPSILSLTSSTEEINHDKIDDDDSTLFLFHDLCMDQSWDEFRNLLPEATTDQLFVKDPEDQATLLHVACEQDAPIDIVYDLTEKGLDLNAMTNEGRSCLYVAVASNSSPKLIRKLLEWGADSTKSTSNGGTPLHIGAQKNVDVEIINLLLQDGNTNPNQPKRNGATPLHLCVSSRMADANVAECILEFGGDPNRRACTGVTPLHLAVINGAGLDVIEVLLDFGADSSLPFVHSSGRLFTPLQLAVAMNHPHLIDVLANPPQPTRAKIDGATEPIACAQCFKLSVDTTKPFPSCEQCGTVFYCSQDCARGHWTIHRSVCGDGKNNEETRDEFISTNKDLVEE
jgi:ankyrin repeat protein